jgi:hypothetical protein
MSQWRCHPQVWAYPNVSPRRTTLLARLGSYNAPVVVSSFHQPSLFQVSHFNVAQNVRKSYAEELVYDGYDGDSQMPYVATALR